MDKGLAPTPLLGELKKRPDFHAAPFLGNYFIRFNATRKPFNDPRVRTRLLPRRRQAVSSPNKITRAGEMPAYSFVPPGTGAGYEPPPGLARDVERARKLLAEAGYPGGSGFPVVYYLYQARLRSRPRHRRRVAGHVPPRARHDHAARSGRSGRCISIRRASLDYDFCRSSWVGDYNDPNTFLDMFVTDGGNNRTGWSNARLRRAHRRRRARSRPREALRPFPRSGEASSSPTRRRSARSTTTSASSSTIPSGSAASRPTSSTSIRSRACTGRSRADGSRSVFAIYRARSPALLCAAAARRRSSASAGRSARSGTASRRPYRRLVLRNLGIAFGREKSPAELRALARKHFATLGANLFSSIKLPRALARRRSRPS